MFKKFIRIMKSQLVITILGFICLALLIWFGGPLLAIAGYEPFISISARIITLLLIIIIWGAIKFASKAKDKKQNEAMVNNLIHGEENTQENTSDDAVKGEIDVLHKKMVQALDILKNTKFSDNKNIYDLPWYIMIGPPGSGKTTAIHHSGLEYPLKEKMGIDMIEGVGGTRHCDWWFTNKAVLIDTAGRYTTQDSHSKRDSRAWQGFLGLLKKFRPLRPINGVVITMGMAELLNQTKTERNLHARAIKQRLQELQNQLNMTFPVYVLFSKTDLIAGFNEFFDDFTKEDCEQIWGVTFPLEVEENEGSIVSTFNKEFHNLLTNLNSRINIRLKHERDLDRRSAIYEFPKQLRLLQSAADDFLKEIFSPNAYEEAPLLRGVYLTSATQEGTPIDHLSSQISTGVKSEKKSSEIKHQRSYFIKRLLEDVIFPEKNLASINRQHDKQNVLLRRSTIAVSSLIAVFFTYAWWSSYDWNSQLVDRTKASIENYQQVTSGGLNSESEIITLTKGLSTLRNLPVGYANEEIADAHTLGLYQGDKFKQPAKAAYKRALEAYLLPYLSKSLSRDMQENSVHLSYLYETLKTYLMLYQTDYYAEDNVKIWFSAYLDRNVPGVINADIRQQLNEHLSTMLEMGVRGNDYNEEVVAQARQDLTMLPLVERAYQRLKSDFSDSSIPDFKLVDILSLESLEGFTFLSDRTFSTGIPSLYTFNGFHGIFNIEKNRIVKRLIEDSWVYGDDLGELDDNTKAEITVQLEAKYIRDYIFYWEDFLSDLNVKSFNTIEGANQVTRALSSADAPIKSIITAVQKNVQLTKVPLSKNGEAAAKIAKSASDVLFQSKKSKIKRLLPNEPIEVEIDLPGKDVELAFTDLLSINIQELEEIQGTLRSINRNISKVTSSSGSSKYMNQDLEDQFTTLSGTLKEQIADAPFPIFNWLDDIASQTRGFAKNNQNQRLNGIWQSSVVAEYKRAISRRYPFSRSATREVRINDFTRFFAYDGTLDKFWTKYLEVHVDTSKKPWRFTQDIGISTKVLKAFQEAQLIREAFFNSGQKSPMVWFSLEASSLDKTVSQLMIEIDGQKLVYRHGPTRKEQFIWPGTSANSETRIVFTPPNGGRSINKKYVGEWSLFKFFDELYESRPETKKDGLLKIALSGYNAEVQFIANSVNNPFTMVNLERFTCPENL
ncbi:type VI secretion system membrane subunit TssM [Pseudocolwellia sp. HL-MZ19]|uniref:type VI secretion system membrane subunit TssM n=1 Tax=Pseudocolwellia sp. HL-MZ19 TaxID=3400846 RepID=UPI003CF77740